jgi:carboxyl-terminal processing protease
VAGENTFGKGIVQTVRELSNNNGGVAITVARYETPQYHDINKQGIAVDVPTAVSCAKDDAAACLKASVFQSLADTLQTGVSLVLNLQHLIHKTNSKGYSLLIEGLFNS